MELDVNQFIEKIIPPNDRDHRESFSNDHYIDQLNSSERDLVEDALIIKLSANKDDVLIIKTLAYLKSIKSLPILYSLLEKSSDSMLKLIVAASIFEIQKDDSLIDVAVGLIDQIDNKEDIYYVYALINVFDYLAKFKNPKTNNVIGSYVDDKEYLIAYNAKRHWVRSL